MSPARHLLLLALSSCLIPAHERDEPAHGDCVPTDEVCDGVDNDCDGLVDERVLQAFFGDADHDGFGTGIVWACTQPPGTSSVDGDCDDGDRTSYPGAPEDCDGIDHDCDGEGTPFGGPWYPDGDGDGFGDKDAAVHDCTRPAGFVTDGTDCDDTEDSVHPGAAEGCDGVDRDCDGTPSAVVTWYYDYDGDSFGDAANNYVGCSQPFGFVADATDCDDAQPLTFPGAPEYCDNIDNNCDPADDLLAGDDASCAVVDCSDLQLLRPTAPDGVYWIDPGSTGAFQAACDMTREGGGWTLVYAYTFTDYANFNTVGNAVSPIPSWTAVATSSPVSTTPPLSESDFNAVDHALWGSIGGELFSVSTIQDWVVCSPGTGDITVPVVGTMSCTNVLDVAPACSGITPTYLNYFTYGWALSGASLFTYWDGSDAANWPTHDPCGLNQANQLTGVADPRGALYLR